MPQDVDKPAVAGNVSATRGKRLAKRTHQNVDLARVHPAVFGTPATMAAQHAEAMGIIDHQPRAIPLLDVHEAGQIGDVTFGRVQSLDDNQRVAILVPVSPQDPLAGFRIVMTKAVAFGSRKARADIGAVVDERIMDDEIILGAGSSRLSIRWRRDR